MQERGATPHKTGRTVHCARVRDTFKLALVSCTSADPAVGVANAFKLVVIDTGTTVRLWPVRSIVPVSVGFVVNVPREADTSPTVHVVLPEACPVRSIEPLPVWVYVTFAM
jgi:hypothetical protein